MANPRKFNPAYSYSGFQSVNPMRPLPGQQVDNDLANISEALNETVDALADIRRDDGALQNGIVTVDSIAPEVVPFFAAEVQSRLEAAQAAAGAASASADLADDKAGEAASSAAAAATSETNASNSAGEAADSAQAAADAAASVPAMLDGKQDASPNLATLAGIVPGAAGQAILAHATAGDTRKYLGAFDTIADAQAANVPPILNFIRTAGYLYKRVGSEPSHAGKFQSADGAWWAIAENIINSVMVGGISNLAPVAYAIGARVHVKAGETAKLPCNPSSGDDFFAMCNWMAGSHLVEKGGEFYIEIADGLHTVSGNLSFKRGRVDIRATAAPTFYQIVSTTAALDSGNIYTVSATIDGVLPARVVAGFVVGGQNCKGVAATARSIEAWNGAHIVTSTLSGNRIFAKVQSFGVALTSTGSTEVDNTLTKGMTANQIAVPQCTLVFNSAGWDGSSVEGVLNADGEDAWLNIENVGMAYSGITSEHDMLFHKGGKITMDRAFVAGAGDKVLRGAYGGYIYAYRSFFGGSTTGQQLWQGIAGASANFLRCFMGSVSGIGISATANAPAFLSQCAVTGCLNAVRPTYPSSFIDLDNTRVSNCTAGLAVTYGGVRVASNVEVVLCTDPYDIDGPGYIYGAATLTDNTNAPIAGNTYINGGGWYAANDKLV